MVSQKVKFLSANSQTQLFFLRYSANRVCWSLVVKCMPTVLIRSGRAQLLGSFGKYWQSPDSVT